MPEESDKTLPGFETKPSWKEIRYRLRDPSVCGSQYGRKRITNGVSLLVCMKKDGTGWINQALRFDKSVFPTIAKAREWYNDHWRGRNEALWDMLIAGEYTNEDINVLTFEVKELNFECICTECDFEMESEEPCNDSECPECGAVMERLSRDVPYVLGKEAVESGWIPPIGFSTLAKNAEGGIPERYHYWKEEEEDKRKEVRDNLVRDRGTVLKVVRKFDETHYLVECGVGKTYLVEWEGEVEEGGTIVAAECLSIRSANKLNEEDFVLMHHYWKGVFTALTGRDVEHFDLFLGNKQFVMMKNPMLGGTKLSIRKPYSKGFSKRGLSTEFVGPGRPGNPTKSTASYVKQLDSGRVSIFEEGEGFKRLEFRGKRLRGLYQMAKPISNKNLWEFGRAKKDTVKVGKLSKGEVVRTICLSGKLQSIKKLDDGTLEVESITLGEGVWNCELYSREAIADRPERILGTPVFVGVHSVKGRHGSTVDWKLLDGRDLWTKDHITHEEGIRKLDSGDYKGPSVEVRVIADEVRHIIHKILRYDRIVYVENPACEVCKVE